MTHSVIWVQGRVFFNTIYVNEVGIVGTNVNFHKKSWQIFKQPGMGFRAAAYAGDPGKMTKSVVPMLRKLRPFCTCIVFSHAWVNGMELASQWHNSFILMKALDPVDTSVSANSNSFRFFQLMYWAANSLWLLLIMLIHETQKKQLDLPPSSAWAFTDKWTAE